MRKGKTINALMKHIRDNHNIDIKGSEDKLNLRNMGYFHGYKGCRFIKESNRKLNVINFQEINSIHNFDLELKGLFYPLIMQIETALKNRTIEVISQNNIPTFENIYLTKLDYHLDYINNRVNSISSLSTNAINHRIQMIRKNQLKVNKKYHNDIEFYYNKDDILFTHYINRNQDIPIWAYFENLTLGNLANFLNILNVESKNKLTELMGLNSLLNIGTNDFEIDHFHFMISKIMYALKDLRNSIAHNSIIFDCRFKTTNFHQTIIAKINREIDTSNLINFNTITDYFILTIILLKGIKLKKSKLNSLIKRYEDIVLELKGEISQSDFDRIIDNQWNNKLCKLKIYIVYL